MIEVTCFESVHSWPNILILGSIHGDEKCGSVAIDEAIQNFQSGKWALKKWKITFIPRANRAAYDRDVRQVEYNLNRIFDSHQNISKEHQIAKLLEKHIENADYVIDLHSVYSGDTPFVFLDSDGEVMKNLCASLSLPYIMTGWNEIYGWSQEKDTISFAISRGKDGITIECGSHKNSESNDVAKRSVREVLEFFEMIDTEKREKILQKFVKVEKLFRRGKNAEFTKNFKNFDEITFGESIGFSDDKEIFAENDGYIILPKAYGNVGDEWYYTGRDL